MDMRDSLDLTKAYGVCTKIMQLTKLKAENVVDIVDQYITEIGNNVDHNIENMLYTALLWHGLGSNLERSSTPVYHSKQMLQSLTSTKVMYDYDAVGSKYSVPRMCQRLEYFNLLHTLASRGFDIVRADYALEDLNPDQSSTILQALYDVDHALYVTNMLRLFATWIADDHSVLVHKSEILVQVQVHRWVVLEEKSGFVV